MERFSLDDVAAMIAAPSNGPRRFSLSDIESIASQPSETIPDTGSGVADLAHRAFVKPAKNAVTGYQLGASDLYRTGANALNLINRGGDYLTEKTGVGIPSTAPESRFGAAERWMLETAKNVAPAQEQLPTDTMGKIYTGLGRAPVDIAQYIAGSHVLGPVAGMAGVEALRESDQGPMAAAQAGAKGALLGGALKATAPLTIPGRVGTMAGIGGTQAAVEGGDASDIAAGAATMGVLGAAGKGGNLRLRDIPGEARRYSLGDVSEMARAERIEPTLEPQDVRGRDVTGLQAEAGEPIAVDSAQLGNPRVVRTFPEPVTDAPIEQRLPETTRATPADGAGEQIPPADVLAARPDRIGDATGNVMEMTPGANHVGMRSQVYDPAVPRREGEPLRRETILGPLFKAFDVPLYEGRIKSDKTLGFFRRPVEEVRIKNKSDIEVAAHEMAHLLDSRVPEIRDQWRRANTANKVVRQELAGVSYDKSKLYEGFAEFVRLWATQKGEARAKAPQFYGWFEDFVARSEYGQPLLRAQTEMHDWFAQHALDRARSKIGVTKTINEFLNQPFDRFRQSVFDDLHGVMRMEKELSGKLNPVGAYETARLLRGKTAFFEGALRFGAPKVNADGSHSFAGKGLEQILKPVAANLDDFLMYSVGRSSRELMGQGREHLFKKSEVDAMLALERPEFRQAFSQYQQWNESILDFAQAKGVIDPMVRRLWKRTDYLPFHRVGQPGTKQAVITGDWKGIKALTGGTENLRDVLGNMIGNAQMLMDAALTNEARVRIADLAKQQGGAKFMAEIPKEDRLVKVHQAEVERAILEALGVRNKTALPVEQQAFIDEIVSGMGPTAEFVLRGQAPLGHNVAAVLRKGKPEYYEVADPILFRSLMSLNRAPQGWAMQLLSMPRRVGQASVTVTFDFIAANIARDTLMGGIMSRNGFRPVIDSAIGMKSRLMRDDTYKQFIANGGGFASYFKDENAFKAHLKRFYASKGIDHRTVLDAPGKLLHGLETIVESFEVATRLGEFRRAVQKGENPRHAAYEAREVSTDFGMRGDSATLGFFYDTVLFLKAATNGMDRLYRGFAHDPNNGAVAAKTGILALLSMGLYAANRDNPFYDQIEDWDKDSHWHFFIPTPTALKAKANGQELPLKDRYVHMRFPKIWEIGAVASLAERSLKGALDGMTAEDAKKMLATVANMMNFDYVPQAVAPLYEQTLNKDRFTGRPIETDAMQELQPWARANAHSSTLLRKTGEATMDLPRGVQIPPARLEHLLKGYFNTWAMYGLTLADGAFYDQAPDIRADQYPVLRRFYRQEPAQHTRYETELYEMIREATEARRTVSLMDKRWRPELADKLENTEENRLYGQAQHIAQRMRVFRKEAEQVVTAETLDQVRSLVEQRAKDLRQPGYSGRARMPEDWKDIGALKRWLLDSLIEEKNEFTERAYRDMKQNRADLKTTAR